MKEPKRTKGDQDTLNTSAGRGTQLSTIKGSRAVNETQVIHMSRGTKGRQDLKQETQDLTDSMFQQSAFGLIWTCKEIYSLYFFFFYVNVTVNTLDKWESEWAHEPMPAARCFEELSWTHSQVNRSRSRTSSYAIIWNLSGGLISLNCFFSSNKKMFKACVLLQAWYKQSA